MVGGPAPRQPAEKKDKRRPSMNFLLPSLKKSNEFNEREEWKKGSAPLLFLLSQQSFLFFSLLKKRLKDCGGAEQESKESRAKSPSGV
jgi:hypothetical protein